MPDDGYAESFGDQWNRWRRVQLDSVTGKPLSRARLFEGTRWPEDLTGQTVLELGCGAGRFTEVLLDAGAEVWAVDASSAVDAARDNLGEHERLHLAQADLFDLPFERARSTACSASACSSTRPTPPRVPDRDPVRRVARRRRLPHAAVHRPLVGEDPVAPAHDADAARPAPSDRRVVRAALASGRHAARARPEARPLPDRGRSLLELHRPVPARRRRARRLGRPRHLRRPLAALRRAADARDGAAWVREAGLVDADVRYGGNGIIVTGRRPSARAS